MSARLATVPQYAPKSREMSEGVYPVPILAGAAYRSPAHEPRLKKSESRNSSADASPLIALEALRQVSSAALLRNTIAPRVADPNS